MCFLTMLLVLFLIMDPIGNISSFIQVLEKVPEKKRQKVLIREMGIALFLMLFFSFIGDPLLVFLNISQETVFLASGTILFLAAIGILYPNSKSIRANIYKEPPPFITPLAVPLVAGPALLATIILYAHVEPDWVCRAKSILAAWALCVVILLAAKPIKRTLTPNGLSAAERLMGMVLVMIAFQRFFEGIEFFRG